MKVLVVDDDRVLLDLISFTLRREQFEVIQALNGARALELWEKEQPDLVVLDANLPQVDGFTVCRRIRQAGDTPVIMLTVRGEEDDIVRGLSLGADDYMLKPFSPRQLVARIQAVLRRSGKAAVPAVQQVSHLSLDPGRREARWGDQPPIALTPLESRLLSYLMLNAGQVLTNEALIAHLWGAEGADRDMLRQVVRRLRAKLALAYSGAPAAEPPPHNFIENISGLGYGLNTPRA